jgi:L-ascorbate metabolism protein UlaG (beta-lactamase superfamily)
MLDNIHWLGHSGFRINNKAGIIIYIDPFRLEAVEDRADLILITHEHYDHFSPEDIAKIKKAETEILIPVGSADKISGRVHGVKPGDRLEIKNLKIEVVPAYNLDKEFHPRENGWVGYIIEVDGLRIYHAGDTDLIPEMNDIKADVVLLPVSGTYTMTAREAAEATKRIKPKIAVPMHYGEIVGSAADAEEFARLAHGEVIIPPKEKN